MQLSSSPKNGQKLIDQVEDEMVSKIEKEKKEGQQTFMIFERHFEESKE
jgi:hypothetical protein